MFNFKNGTALAIQQDTYLKKYLAGEKISIKEISDMEQNLWVAIASKLAPGNLVLRQWALIDLFRGSAWHREDIQKMMDILTYKEKGPYKIWAESYSYFNYTLDVINPWIERYQEHYDMSVIKDIIEKTEQGFIATAYLRDGVWYPAPFGDLRDAPLNPDLQIPHPMKTIAISNVIFNYAESDEIAWYSIGGKPLGLNTHINKDSCVVSIIKGNPMHFKFYTGYSNKYANYWEEFRDTFSWNRILAVPF